LSISTNWFPFLLPDLCLCHVEVIMYENSLVMCCSAFICSKCYFMLVSKWIDNIFNNFEPSKSVYCIVEQDFILVSINSEIIYINFCAFSAWSPKMNAKWLGHACVFVCMVCLWTYQTVLMEFDTGDLHWKLSGGFTCGLYHSSLTPTLHEAEIIVQTIGTWYEIYH
jgi:hypothetical protein